MNSPTCVVEASKLCKRFGEQKVIDSLSLSCYHGDVVLLLGANGAGKSTLLRMLSGLSRPDSGSVICEAGVRVGLVAHHSFLYGRLSVAENITLYSQLLGVHKSRQRELSEEWGLQNLLDTPLYQLSKGTQGKVSIVRALLGDPKILLLDEPSSNLDQRATETLSQTLVAQREKGAAIIATHDVSRLEGIATRVVLLDRGGCVADSGSGASDGERRAVIERYYEANR